MRDKSEKKTLYLGIDIGGTEVKFGNIDADGTVEEKASYRVNFDGYETPILRTVISSCRLFMEQTHRSPSDYLLIGVSATGQVSLDGVIAGTAGHIPNWKGSRVREELEREFSLPVYVINDANAAALGEAWTGAARGKRNVVVVTIGTGVGGGVLVDGNLLLGSSGYAGELGHFPVQFQGDYCTCGNCGCLEYYGSMTALIRCVRRLYPDRAPEEIDGRWIFARVSAGDLAVRKVLDEWIGVIAAALVGFTHLFNPEQILIGGGVSEQEELFIEPLRERVLGHVMKAFAGGLEICAAQLHNEAGMVGAVYYGIRQETIQKQK